MPIPTSELTPTPDGATGLPDVATLARMANSFFNALPGAVPSVDSTFEPGRLTPDSVGAAAPAGPDAAAGARAAAPGSATSGAAIPAGVLPGNTAPTLAFPGTTIPGGTTSGLAPPSSAPPGGAPSTTAIPNSSLPGAALPGPAGAASVNPGAANPGTALPGSAVPGAAAAPGAWPPGATMPDAAGPSSPGAPSAFYFLDYAGSGWDTLSGSAAATLDNLAALSAQPPSALPTGADLGVPRSPPTTLSGLPGGAPSFYFLDPTPGTADFRALQEIGRAHV